MTATSFTLRGCVALTMLAASGLAVRVLAASSAPQENPPATTASATRPASAPTVTGLRHVGAGDAPVIGPPAWWERLYVPRGFWPDLAWPTLAWFGAAAILALMLRLKPLLSLRNLDALVLTATCLLLALRAVGTTGASAKEAAPQLAYVGLTVTAGYWLLRGVWLVLAKQTPRGQTPVAGGPLCVLLLAGLALCIHQVAAGPISPGARDGIVGGVFMAEKGKLPYGDALGHDSRSPLLYLLHAGAVKVVEPCTTVGQPEVVRPMTWADRSEWLQGNWWEQADLAPARLVYALLFIGTLAGIYVIGRRLHSVAMSWTLAAVFCVFPGTLECLPRPEIMLPAMLLTWTIALALLPAGSLLATLCLVLAGLAWPWAWLGLPVLVAYFARRGWQAAGSVVGLLSGVAACVMGIATLVQPALPRADGALAMAGMTPSFEARPGDDGTIVVKRWQPVAADRPWSRWLWRVLVESESLTVRPTGTIDWPNGVEAGEKLFRALQATGDALPPLQADYRRAVRELSPVRQGVVALRTLLETTWVPAQAPPTTTAGAWELWGGPPPMDWRWVLARRIVKGAIGLLMIWATLAIFIGRRNQPRHLVGALLAVSSGVLLASESGAVTNLVWLLPAVLALWAVDETPQEPAPLAPTVEDAPLEPEPPPRITAEN